MKKKSNSLKKYDEDIDFYIQKIKNIPSLSKDEEFILAKKLKEKNDIQAARKLVESNINYVIKIARNYSGYGLNIKDLIQEGLIGLMKAVKKFDPDKKHRLISFAIYWIKSEIQEYIIRNLRLVKITSTKTQKKLFFNLKKIKKIGWLTDKEKSSLSNLLSIKYEKIDYMESRLNNPDTPIITSKSKDDNIEDINQINNCIDKLEKKQDPLILVEKNNWSNFIINKLNKALYKLDRRSQNILKKRWLTTNANTLKTLAKTYNISSERVRQVENNTLKKLKNLIKLDI